MRSTDFMSDFSCTAAPTGQVFKAVPMIVATSSVKGRAPSPYSLRARARVQSFYVLAFTSSPFWCKVLIDCALRVKVSPFCLHRFFATDVVQRVVFQIVAVKVKVNAGSAFTLKLLIYILLRGEVKGEGKNGKFAESAGAYIRVGACPARRVKGILCGGGRFEIKQGRKSRKVGTFGEKVGLYFSSGVGEGENNACFPFFYACKSRNWDELQAKTPRQTDFFGENRDFGREFLAN